VIVGGIIFSLLLTLFVIPAIYVFLSTKKKGSELDKYDNPVSATGETANQQQ
jgi:multidrug efflux pump